MKVHDRWRVVTSIEQDMTYSTIQKKYGYTPDFIARWWRRYKETGGVDDAPRSGRPHKLDNAQVKEVVRYLKRPATSSLRKTAKRMKIDHDVDISDYTVARTAKLQGLHYRLRKKKPRLSEEDKKARLHFANQRRPRHFWERVMWSDEASFALFSSTRWQWVVEGSEAAPRETVKWPPRIRIWAAISAKGKTPLVRIPKSMTAEDFETLLKEKLLPLMRDVYADEPKGFVFMQDGDGTQTAKRVQKALADESIELLLPWPAHSPDLNPIENAWSMVERHSEIRKPTTEAGLWEAMNEGWENIDVGALTRLTMSPSKRLEAVKAALGGHTKY
jgi:transposase